MSADNTQVARLPLDQGVSKYKRSDKFDIRSLIINDFNLKSYWRKTCGT